MILLTATNETLELATSSTSATDVNVSYIDIASAAASDPESQETLITTATTTTILAAPAASTKRIVKMLTVMNTGGANQAIVLKKDIGGTEYDLFTVTLGAGEMLQYIDNQGFLVFASTGAIKNSFNQGANAISSAQSAAVLAADVTNNNAVANTIADVTGLAFPVTSGKKYKFRFEIQYTAAATTTGSRWAVNFTGGGAGTLRYRSQYSLTATTDTINNAVAVDIPAASNATSANTTGNIAIIEGFVEASANGNLIARFASEVASSAIVAKAGSVVYYQEVL